MGQEEPDEDLLFSLIYSGLKKIFFKGEHLTGASYTKLNRYTCDRGDGLT